MEVKLQGQPFVVTQHQYIPSDKFSVQHKLAIRLERDRSTASLTTAKIAKDDVVELNFSCGFKQWLRGSELKQHLDTQTTRDTSTTALITAHSFQHLIPKQQTRGVGEVILKLFKVIEVRLVDQLATLSRLALVHFFEKKQIKQAGLYQGTQLDQLRFCKTRADIDIKNSQQAVLLFIHGTFVNSQASFHYLWDNPHEIQALLNPYGEQVFFLEHYTLTQSPMSNALMVVDLFPIGTRLHIISHSRGGLVGELLCQGKLKRRSVESKGKYIDSELIFSAQELQAFNNRTRRAEFNQLNTLQEQLQSRDIQVERFIRIAAPARGTLLASRQLEDILQTTFNVLNFLPIPQLHLSLHFIETLLLAILKGRQDSQVLPGIECMMPNAPLIALLNRNAVRLKSELTVITGKVAPESLSPTLKKWLSNIFSDQPHDLIVSTRAMQGGCRRVNPTRYRIFLVQSSHFNYFKHPKIYTTLRTALIGTFVAPTTPLLSQKYPANHDRSETLDKQNVVYFIPGVFASQLNNDEEPIWMDIAALQWGDFNRLAIDQHAIKTTGLLTGHYDALLNMLSDTHQVIPFSYDWRRSHVLAGQQLGELLQKKLDDIANTDTPQSIRLLVHSTGSFVLKALILECPDVWKQLINTVDCHIVIIGGSFSGSHRMVQLLAGQHHLSQLLNMLEEKPLDSAEITQQLADYAGILELLPTLNTHDYFTSNTWQELFTHSPQFDPHRLDAAKAVRQQLDAITLNSPVITYIAGQASQTPSTYQYKNQIGHFIASKMGDGFSLWQETQAINPDKQWFIPTEHGNLINFPTAFKGITDLLQTGNTQQLSPTLPRVNNDAGLMPTLADHLYPDKDDVLAAALNFSGKNTPQAEQYTIRISVVHGNLEHVKHAIVVGHYEGDSIVSAENVLDQRLNGRMRELHRLGMYPGKINTSKVLLNNGNKPSGAIIVGLGEVGKLSVGDLLESYTHALLDYALLMRDYLYEHQLNRNEIATESLQLSISTVLVGSGFGGLPPQESIITILRAVKRANKALKKNHQGRNSVISALELVELYEDRAVEALKFLHQLAPQYEYKQSIVVHEYLRYLPGGHRRIIFNQQSGWWQRMQVEADEQGTLRYLTLTDRARAESELQPTQAKLVDKFIAAAIQNSHDDREIGKTLFELLVPNDLKDYTHDLKNLLMILNKKSAGIPWELLQNRFDVGAVPIAVQSGMLRQLQTENAVSNDVINPSHRVALVIATPKAKGFADLPAATKEAHTISEQLMQQGFEVNSQIDGHAISIMNALHGRDYRLLHLAGHGVFEYDNKGEYEQAITGMVLGDDIFLTPIEIRQMRKVPEFVFINCCHLGKIDAKTPKESWQNRHKLAANLASELIDMGVRAIVAAGWTVNDDAASCFSRAFYQALLQGQTFGESVLVARQQTYREFETTNTWGAYQCYGDPAYILTHHAAVQTEPQQGEDKESSEYPTAIPEFVSENEVLLALENLANASDSARIASFEYLSNQLSQIEQAIQITWLSNAHIRTALGKAHGKLDHFEAAITHYEVAQTLPQAHYPVSMLEDLVSLKTAWALALLQTAAQQIMLQENLERQSAWQTVIQNKPQLLLKAHTLLDSALDTLDLLQQLGQSIQRWEERGKLWKRKAILSQKHDRSAALKQMQAAYKQAHQMALLQYGHISPYPLLNWQTCQFVCYLRKKDYVITEMERLRVANWLTQLKQYANTADAKEPLFCSDISLAEGLILSYMIETDRLSKQAMIEKTVDYYAQAIARGTAPRQIRFVSEHLQFLILMLEKRQDNHQEIATIIDVLERILTMLSNTVQPLEYKFKVHHQ